MQVGGRTKREAQAALTKVLAEIDQGTYSEPVRETMAQFMDRWLKDCAPGRVSERTLFRYAELNRVHILPALGGIAVQSLRAPHLQALYADRLERGRVDGHGGLSPQSVLHIHRLLHEVLEQAVRWRVLSRNPADDVDPPRVRRQEMKTWNAEQITVALEAAEGQWIYLPILLALTTGMRSGEILALQWGDVDFNRASLVCRRSACAVNNRASTPVIYKQPKSGHGRKITLPSSLVEALLAQQSKQQKECALLGREPLSTDFVTGDPDGSGLAPHELTGRFRRFLRAAGKDAALPVVRFHDLRHSHATLLLTIDTNPKVVSERLGHSDVRLTLNTYSHVLPAMQDEAAKKLEPFFRKAPKPIRLESAG
jgi:integrase